MLVKIFSVFDTKGGAFLQPFYAMSKGHAIRSFTDSTNTEGHTFNKYPEDFILFELGDFDDSNAKFHILPEPLSIGLALEFKKC